MDKKIKILHLEDSIRDSELIHSLIESGIIGYEYFLADNEKDFKNFLETENIDIILSDYSLPDYNGNEALKVAREKYSYMPFIFVSGAMGEDAAINAMLNGATDYVLKHKLDRLIPAIIRAMKEHELEIQRKQAEIDLKEKNEEIKAQNEKYIQINKELLLQYEEKEKQVTANKELEAFSYSVSHDLRAPLRHIGGFVDLLSKNNSSQLDETGLRYLNTISESTREMGNLIDALLTFSRFSRAELQRTKINSKNMVTRLFKSLSDDYNGRNIEFNISELPDAMGDENLINQVWVNLISNALKYSRNKEKTIIDIGGKIENDKTIYFIKDNGAGFDMKYADKLFGVFQRLHKARDFEGIGIGLANVNRIITRHGGKCWAEGEVGNGATFFFNVPNN